MSKLLGFIGLTLIVSWLLLLAVGCGVLLTNPQPEEDIFEMAIPWFRWSNYAALFLVMGACCKFLFGDKLP